MKCCEITAGKLRHRISIQRKVSNDDGMGGGVMSWQEIKSTRAMITPLSGRESLQAQRIEAETTHRLYMRYFADLEQADKVVYDGRDFNIKAIINIEERNKYLELQCKEGVAQ